MTQKPHRFHHPINPSENHSQTAKNRFSFRLPSKCTLSPCQAAELLMVFAAAIEKQHRAHGKANDFGHFHIGLLAIADHP
ncbi:MAG: hypothetical protein ACK532_08685 [Acidobacteriota bacterium]